MPFRYMIRKRKPLTEEELEQLRYGTVNEPPPKSKQTTLSS